MSELAYRTDIMALEAEIRQTEIKLNKLRRQYDIKSVEHSIELPAGTSNESIISSISEVEDEGSEAGNVYLENINRLSGISAFRIKNFDGFGIRIEMFSRGKFLAPHYVMIRKTEKGLLQVFRHTVPVFIPINSYQKQYLNDNILLFADKIRQDLYSCLSKQYIFMDSSLPGVKKVEVDASCRLVNLHLENDMTLHLVCNAFNIQKAILVDRYSNSTAQHSLEGPILRLRDRLETLQV